MKTCARVKDRSHTFLPRARACSPKARRPPLPKSPPHILASRSKTSECPRAICSPNDCSKEETIRIQSELNPLLRPWDLSSPPAPAGVCPGIRSSEQKNVSTRCQFFPAAAPERIIPFSFSPKRIKHRTKKLLTTVLMDWL